MSQSYVSQKCVHSLVSQWEKTKYFGHGAVGGSEEDWEIGGEFIRALESRPPSTELSLPRQRKGGLYPNLHPHLKEENMFQIWVNI